jgi:hypothetical protein
MYGRAIVQAVCRRHLTAESRVRARVNPCGICGGQSGTRTGSSPSSSVFPCQHHPTVVLHTHISSEDEQYVRYWQQFKDVVSPDKIINKIKQDVRQKKKAFELQTGI